MDTSNSFQILFLLRIDIQILKSSYWHFQRETKEYNLPFQNICRREFRYGATILADITQLTRLMHIRLNLKQKRMGKIILLK